MLDEHVPTETAIQLRQVGFDVQTVSDKMPSASDEYVLDYSIASGRMLITADSDLSRLVCLHKWNVPDGLVLNRESWDVFPGRIAWALLTHGRENMIMVFARNELRARAPIQRGFASREAVRHQYVKKLFPDHLAVRRHSQA